MPEKLPSPFIRYRCSSCNCWIREEAVICRCGAVFEARFDIRHARIAITGQTTIGEG